MTTRSDNAPVPNGQVPCLVEPGPAGARITLEVPAQHAGELRLRVAADGSTVVVTSRLRPVAHGTTASGRLGAWARGHAAWLAFLLAIGLYWATRLIALDEFPIYFFSDEAVQAVRAQTLVENGWRDHLGRLLPTYFENVSFFNLSTSVYLQVLPYLAFGKTIFTVRLVNVMLTTVAALFVTLILRQVFAARWWWSGVLLLGGSALWFLYSRTAFENAVQATFLAGAIYAYLMYRVRDPRYLFATLVLGALAFYSYRGGQVAVAALAVGWLALDWRYHWEQHRLWPLAGLLTTGLIAPQIRHMLEQPDEITFHLRMVSSYWVEPGLTTSDKLLRFVGEYLYGLSPQYWFVLDNGRDLIRHRLLGYSQLPWYGFPFLIVGLIGLVRGWHDPARRGLLVALLTAPAAGALAQSGGGRILIVIIPMVVVMGLGVHLSAGWLAAHAPAWGRRAGPALYLALSAAMLWLTADALLRGPTMFSNYGLYGMQYGARQVFDVETRRLLAEDPARRVYISPTWANGTDLLQHFFLTPEESLRVEVHGADWLLSERKPIQPQDVFILSAEEYARVLASPKLAPPDVLRMILFPDGSPGFYIAHVRYSTRADGLFAAERVALLRPRTGDVDWLGQTVTVTYTNIEEGHLRHVFDGDAYSLVRTIPVGSAEFDIRLHAPVEVHTLALTVGTMAQFEVVVSAYDADGQRLGSIRQIFGDAGDDPTVEVALPGAISTAHLVVAVTDLSDPTAARVHVRDIALRP